jgi:hypothetical protein
MQPRFSSDKKHLYFTPEVFNDPLTAAKDLGLYKIPEYYMELFMFKDADALSEPHEAPAGVLPNGVITPGGGIEYTTTRIVFTYSPLRARTGWIPITE